MVRLMEMPGLGPLNSTAFIAAIGDPRHFPSGRCFSVSIGLTPHEHSSGDKQQLFGISKRGDRYLHTLLIHGARSALRCVVRRVRMTACSNGLSNSKKPKASMSPQYLAI